MAPRKRKQESAEEEIDTSWRLCEGSDGPFKAAFVQVKFNPYEFDTILGSVDYRIELSFDNGDGVDRKPLEFYLRCTKENQPPTLTHIIDYLVKVVVAKSQLPETKKIVSRMRPSVIADWIVWFHLSHYCHLASRFKELVGDDLFAAIAVQEPS